MALPTVSGRQVINVLSKLGFQITGRKGSHVKLKKKEADKVLIVIIPDHGELGDSCIEDEVSLEEFKKFGRGLYILYPLSAVG